MSKTKHTEKRKHTQVTRTKIPRPTSELLDTWYNCFFCGLVAHCYRNLGSVGSIRGIYVSFSVQTPIGELLPESPRLSAIGHHGQQMFPKLIGTPEQDQITKWRAHHHHQTANDNNPMILTSDHGWRQISVLLRVPTRPPLSDRFAPLFGIRAELVTRWKTAHGAN